MAFFKFPWLGGQQSAGAGAGGARRGRAAQAESIEEMRRRARHRLIGAVVLVIAGVVVFPLIFDTQPRPVPVDVAITIPDRNAVAPLAAAPAATDKLPKGAGLSPGEEQVGEGVRPGPAAQTPARPEPKAEPRPEEKPEPKAEAKAEAKSEPKAEPAKPAASRPPAAGDDAARARALLEGRAAQAAPPAAAGQERFIVQVGAFADQAKVREVRAKLERAGIKTYAQAVATKDGQRTRVRVGPFADRAEADKALGRVKSLGLDGAVLTL